MVFAGAIYIRQDYGGAVMCEGCSFVNNYARISGGAIHNDGRNVSMDSCTFILNRAGLYGGALAMAGKSMRGWQRLWATVPSLSHAWQQHSIPHGSLH